MERTTVIAVATYFGGQLVGNCVQSILQNVSEPHVFLYKNEVGWSAACNKIISTTTEDILLLNDDTLVLTDVAKIMSDLAYSDPKIGIVGGKSLSTNQESIINYGVYVAPDGNTAHRYFGQSKDSVTVEKQRAVEGSCMFIKRELINDIGVLDLKYGMGYRAEIDFCFRAREKGWQILSSPEAEYVHFVSQTAGRLHIENDTHDIFMSAWGTKLKLGEI